MKCLRIDDNPNVVKYEVIDATAWSRNFPVSKGRSKSVQDPLTTIYKKRSLQAYAVGRLKAIQLANGEGRLSEEKQPGGWDGAEVHKNESRKQPMLWTRDVVVLFAPTY